MGDWKEFILWTSVFLLLSRNKASSLPGRLKRVIYGVPVIGRTTGYDAVSYFGAVGTRHGLPWYSWEADYFVGDRVECSSAVLTPEIVQTACHCLATFEVDKTKFFRAPSVDFHWETIKVVYVGVNKRFGDAPSFASVKPIRSKKFIIHQSCGKFQSDFITHDYGWLKVDPLWSLDTSGVPTAGVSFAPLYPEGQLRAIWEYNIRKRAICLFIGFGYFWPGEFSVSEVLRHGWSVLLSRNECKLYTTDGIPRKNISDYMSWVCTAPFSNHDQPAGLGDSGGPVSCNNYYFAVGSSVATIANNKKLWGFTKTISVPGGIAFSVFENALEYRQDFMKYICDYGKYTFAEHIGLIPIPTHTFRPNVRSRAHQSPYSHVYALVFFTPLFSVTAAL